MHFGASLLVDNVGSLHTPHLAKQPQLFVMGRGNSRQEYSRRGNSRRGNIRITVGRVTVGGTVEG